ncbi:MAG: hypothetical protein WD771_05445 [Gemmatimonadaceae bacterium]
MSRFLPADHSKGDEHTIGGYAAVHGRPAAFDARDGLSYSVEILVDAAADPRGRFGAYLFFLRWRRIGEEGVEGHLESACLEFGETRQEAMDALGAWSIERAQRELDALLDAEAARGAPSDDGDDA